MSGDGFDLDCVRHHAVQLSGTLWRRATLVRYWADFFISLGGLSVPVGVLGRFGATVSARKNPVPGGLAFALAKERRKTDDSVF